MKRSKNTYNHNDDFGKFLKQELPEAPKDEWFIKKTMNRLPPKQKRIFSNPELISYALAFILLIGWGFFICTNIISSEIWTTIDMLNCSMFTVGWITLSWNVLAKVVRTS